MLDDKGMLHIYLTKPNILNAFQIIECHIIPIGIMHTLVDHTTEVLGIIRMISDQSEE